MRTSPPAEESQWLLNFLADCQRRQTSWRHLVTLCDICDISMIRTIKVARGKILRSIMYYNDIIAPSSLLALSQSGCNQLPGSKHFHFFTAILLCSTRWQLTCRQPELLLIIFSVYRVVTLNIGIAKIGSTPTATPPNPQFWQSDVLGNKNTSTAVEDTYMAYKTVHRQC